MNAYIYKAAIYCEDCGHTIQRQLLADGNGYVPSSWPNDSELWPQGPYVDGGGEADSPTHCDRCLVFLENPLLRCSAKNVYYHGIFQVNGERGNVRKFKKLVGES